MERPFLNVRLGAALVLGLVAFGPGAARGQAKAQLVVSGVSNVLYATAPPGDDRLFLVQRPGVIRVFKDGALLATPFLDISALVSVLGEGGLLGLAFPADYATSGLFTVYYTTLDPDDPMMNTIDSVVARYSVSGNPDVADAGSAEELLYIDQPDAPGFLNHKGGTIHYGPDGFLWFATGDGGGSNDPAENAQNPQSLLGKMLRLDVGPDFAPDSITVPGEAYRIPADNPFVGSAPRDEIWALGLRNPFRWSFDRETGDIWIGDVGQGAREEVDFEPVTDPGGRNYGWDVMEGTACNGTDPAPSPPCNHPSLTLPVHDYPRPVDNCASITGGNVFRHDFGPLYGLYFFGDFCTGQIWTLNPADGVVQERTAELGAAAGPDFTLVAFGEDGLGHLLVVHRAGSVYRIVPAAPPSGGCGLGPELAFVLAALAGVRRLSRSPARASSSR